MQIFDMSKVFRCVFIFWFVISIASLTLNLVKIPSEYREWGNISDYQKRYKIFGDFYSFLYDIKSKTNNKSKVLIVTSDPRAFYLSNYFLYPRNIAVSENLPSAKLINSAGVAYIYAYDKKILGYPKISDLRFVDSKNFGAIYLAK